MLPVFVDSVYVGPGQDQLFYDLCESLFCRISQRRVAPSIRSLNGGSACQESLDNGNDPTPCSEHERSFAAHQRVPERSQGARGRRCCGPDPSAFVPSMLAEPSCRRRCEEYVQPECQAKNEECVPLLPRGFRFQQL